MPSKTWFIYNPSTMGNAHNRFPSTSRMRFSKASIITPAICPSTVLMIVACICERNANRTSNPTFVIGPPCAPAGVRGTSSHFVERYSKRPSLLPGNNPPSPDELLPDWLPWFSFSYLSPLLAWTVNFSTSQSTRDVNVSLSGP